MEKKSLGQETLSFIGESFAIVGKFFASRLLISLILGVLSFFTLWILGVYGKWPISIIVAILNLVPYAGPIASMIISAIIVVIFNPVIFILWVIIMLFTFQLLDGVVLSPIIMGKSLGLHPLVVFFAVIIGGSVFGILGILLAVPIAAIAALLVSRIRKRNQTDESI